MAKDPAFLFYPGDWLGGTMTMNRHQKGCYIDLLIAQFNIGPLSLDQIKILLGTDQASWTVLQAKFKREVNSAGGEVFFNERLATEIEKRNKFIQHQSDNGKKGGRPKKPKETHGFNLGKARDKPLENENRNENENREDRGVGKGGEGFFLNDQPMEMELTNVEINAVKEFLQITAQKKLTDQDVKKFWQAFKIDNFKKHEWYGSREKLLSHFRHSLKNELNKKINGSRSKQSGQAAAIANLIEIGEAEFAALRKEHSGD